MVKKKIKKANYMAMMNLMKISQWKVLKFLERFRKLIWRVRAIPEDGKRSQWRDWTRTDGKNGNYLIDKGGINAEKDPCFNAGFAKLFISYLFRPVLRRGNHIRSV